MKIVYVAHPIGGDVKRNMELVEARCGEIYRNRPEILPIAPYLMALRFLDDNDPSDRARGVAFNKELFERRGVIDELWLFGPRISRGMWEEVTWARARGIPVVPMTKDTQLDLLRQETKKGDSLSLLLCGPSIPLTVTYLGEMSRESGIRVRAHRRSHQLWWGDIVSISPAYCTT
jgi:hypothetical protein